MEREKKKRGQKELKRKLRYVAVALRHMMWSSVKINREPIRQKGKSLVGQKGRYNKFEGVI